MSRMYLPSILATILAGCATAPPPSPPPPVVPEVLARPPRPEPPPDTFEHRIWEEDGSVWVLPIAPPISPWPGDVERGVGLARILLHAIDAVPALMPEGLAVDPRASPVAALPLAALAPTSARFIVGGRLDRPRGGGLEVTLWLMDRAASRVVSRTVALDLPRLVAPRNLLADLLADVGAGPNELERSDMTWYEDLDADGLALAGATTLAVARYPYAIEPAERDAIDALIARADGAAPWSFVVQSAVAEHLAPGLGCTQAAVDRFSKVLSLNRKVPFTLEPFAMSCMLGAELEGGPSLPAWSRQSGSHCRIGAKGLTSVASTRGQLARNRSNSRFITGLGGLYRGDTCEAGFAVMQHGDDELGPPLVKAGLELEAAFYFYAERDLPKSTRWFRRAEATAAADPDHCLVALLGAEATLGLADLALEDGRQDDARAAIPSAQATAERCGDQRMLGRIFNTLALIEQSESHFDKSLALLAKAREIFERIADTMNLAVIDANVGVTWLHLGRLDRAVPRLEAALEGKRRVRSVGGVGVLLENLGVAALARGDHVTAARHFDEALGLARDYHTIATLHVQLARIALARGDLAEATTHMDEAKRASISAHSRVLDAVIEQTDAAVSIEAGRYQAALEDFHEALAIRRAIGDRAGEGITLSLLMTLASKMEQPAVAILYGKLAVAAHQDVRVAAGAVDEETAREFLETRAESYRQLADLLVSQGRLIEAERVLALLKEDEASRYTRDAIAPGGVPLTVAEKRLEARYDEVANKVMALGKEHGELAAKWPRTPKEEARLDKLRVAIEAANARFSDFLQQIATKSDALERSRELEDLREGAGIGPDLADLGPGYVAVYTLVGDKALHLIVVSPDTQVARSVPLFGDLYGLIATFRAALQDPTRDPRAAGQALWDLLVKPIAPDLEQAGAKTILWSLDRALRYVPMNALWDGQRFALERWAMAVFTPASKARLKDEPQRDWRVLALGVTSEHPPFPALPAVADELGGIVRTEAAGPIIGVLPGLKALDGQFTKDFLIQQLTRRWPVVHLASHFSFQPGDKDESYLLLGDGGRLTVGELERLPNLFQGVDLLTLSACNTASGDLGGDGTEVESFAVLAQRKGARAVFASLWPVADQSTSALMRRFYALRAGSTTKLEALRAAQLELAQGSSTPPEGSKRAKPLVIVPAGGSLPSEPEVSHEPLDPAVSGWRHPYYWAPFILVGNVR